ncbi:MAG: sulfotransferase domain-containing protein [Cyanobacteria bacterium P01_F01_bin.143]
MPKITIAKVSHVFRLSSKNSEYFHDFNIDSPKNDNELISNKVKISGWILSKKSSVESIEILAEDQSLQRITLHHPRQDVLNVYNDISVSDPNIGFSTLLNISELSKYEKVAIIIKVNFSDGNQEQLAKIVVSFNNEIEYPGPDFIVIGAMKSATSAIYNYICQHPRVIKRYPKELHFFTLNFAKGLDWYLSQFDARRENEHGQELITGEASPSYLVYEETPSRILSMFPHAKIIVLLRNPTDRAISHYYHQVNRVKNENRTIEQAFSAAEIEKFQEKPISATFNYIENGLYSIHLKKWLEIFSKQQMLILNYHDLENNSDHLIEELFSFLGLQDHLITNVKKFYGNQYPEPPLSVKQSLDNFFKPYNEELEKMIRMKI